jgi:anti-anti-sigma factor
LSYCAAVALNIAVESTQTMSVVRVAGEVDLATATQLRAAISYLDGIVGVDLSGVTFLDSAGLNALVGAKNGLVDRGGQLKLSGPQPNVRAVLEVAGLIDWFEVD